MMALHCKRFPADDTAHLDLLIVNTTRVRRYQGQKRTAKEQVTPRPAKKKQTPCTEHASTGQERAVARQFPMAPCPVCGDENVRSCPSEIVRHCRRFDDAGHEALAVTMRSQVKTKKKTPLHGSS